ncbi:MAG TPA: YdcF family protein [Bryobacteraceae bacterium]|nr:YdcF family protein [Bryobacteraceae bacterium]
MMFWRRIPSARPSRRGGALLPVLVVILALILLWLFHEPVLSSVGTVLDNGEAPHKADAIVVLAGGWRGERILAAADLKERGYSPVVIISGASTLYGQNECQLAMSMVGSMGRSTDGYMCAGSLAESTLDEAGEVVLILRARGMKRVLVVSCDTHMRRASRLWRKAAPDLDLTFVSAPSPNFELKRWYAKREGRKAVSLEWMKMVTSYFGI